MALYLHYPSGSLQPLFSVRAPLANSVSQAAKPLTKAAGARLGFTDMQKISLPRHASKHTKGLIYVY